jgi:archaeosortase B (VPXXXP-CTERM-specific)
MSSEDGGAEIGAAERTPSDTSRDGKPPGGRGPIDRIRDAWNNPAFRFVFLFLLYLGISSVAYPIFRENYREVLDALMRGTALIEYLLFLPFTDDVSARGTMVVLMGFSVKIIEECTGVYEVIIFSAAVLAFPTTWAKRGIGFAFGIPTIYAFNAIRIAVLILVGKFYPASFEFMHLYFWQATLIVMITSVWALWIFKVVIREPRPDPTG